PSSNSWFNGGNLGIGNTTPSNKLDVGFAGSTVGLRLWRNDAAGNAYMEIGNGTSYTGQYRIGYDTTGGFAIYDVPNSTIRFFVKSNGNVGLGGNTNPGTSLDLASGGAGKISHVDGVFGDSSNSRLVLASYPSGTTSSSTLSFWTAN